MQDNQDLLYWQRKIFEKQMPPKIGKLINLVQKHKPQVGTTLILGAGESAYARVILDNNRNSHLLIAGNNLATTTILINSFILSIIYQYTPEQCKILLFDTANGAPTVWRNFAHLSQPILTNAADTFIELQKIKREISNRKLNRTQNSKQVIILNHCENLIRHNRQLFDDIVMYITTNGAAVGIHLILATNKTEMSVINGTVKACFAQRIVSKTDTDVESRLVINNDKAQFLHSNNFILCTATDCYEVMPATITDADIQSGIEHSNLYFDTPANPPAPGNKYDEIEQFAIENNGIRLSRIQLLGLVGYGAAQNILDKLISDGVICATADEDGKYPLNHFAVIPNAV